MKATGYLLVFCAAVHVALGESGEGRGRHTDVREVFISGEVNYVATTLRELREETVVAGPSWLYC